MSAEDFTSKPDVGSYEANRQFAAETGRQGNRLRSALGELASDGAEISGNRNDYEQNEPPFESGSPAAKAYAHERGASGKPRWMERFSKVDILGRPTVFSDQFDRTDRGI
jgi:hypothetical protein